MKYLRATMNDGTVWDIPAAVIAKNRALYFAERDSSISVNWEFSYAMDDNTDWEQVQNHAVLRPSPRHGVDMQRAWLASHMEIVDERDE